MSIDKFVRMLNDHALWFARPYTFPDKWDGHYPPSYLKRMRAVYGNDAMLERDFERRFKRRRYGFYVNCWNQSEQECLAMWKLYGASPEGVAIRSTIDDAIYCLHPHASGTVTYYDPKDGISHDNVFAPFDDILYKRKQFEYEREFRLWQCDDETLQRLGDRQPECDVSSLDDRGMNCGIEDMNRLIHKLVVAPDADDEFVEKVRAICIRHGKNGEHRKEWLANRVERSTCDLEPSAFE